MPRLTDKRIATFIENKGSACPFCGSDEIEGESFDTDGGTVEQEQSCLNCDKSWTAVYSLTGVRG